VLALLWHAPHEVIAAGGFRRAYEIFKRTPNEMRVCVVDDEPSFLRGIDIPNIRLEEYRIPRIVRKLEEDHFWFERVLEWILATIIMIFTCFHLWLAGEKYDVIFVPSSEQVPALLAGIAVKYLFHARLVACNLNIDIFPAPFRAPLTRLHNRADEVIAISEHLAAELKAYGLRVPVAVNGVGLDTEAIEAVAVGRGKRQFEAVFVGRHDPEKGLFDLVEIWTDVVKEHPEARLIMIGSCNPGTRERLVASIESHGLEDNIALMGVIDDPEKFSLMKKSKVCLFPSHVEEWGIVPQEALACGLPVVAYDLPVYRENIKECAAVFTAPIGDIAGMSSLTSELLTGEAYRGFERIGPEFVKKFGWDEVASGEFLSIAGDALLEVCTTGGSGVWGGGARSLLERVTKKIIDSPPTALKEALKKATVWYCKAFKQSRTFTFNGREHHYFYHPYNLAWRNERTIEVPIASELLLAHEGQSILEVGNVLGHYIDSDHDVLDKYEEAEGVTNEDVVDFNPGKNYDLILSVSTLEHVGWDEVPRDPGKVAAAVNNMASLLAPGGEFMATVPLGFNQELDRQLENGALPFSDVYFLKRIGRKNEWKQTDLWSALGSKYGGSAFRAKAIAVGFIRKG
jgi:glycosyltransferase involved in cell wall biosynthesis/SAM-dependent methyltransferase